MGFVAVGRTNEQCRLRWVHNLDLANGNNGKTRSWTPEEDAKLTKAVQRLGKNWAAAAVLVPGRIGNQCRQRWILTLDPANGSKCCSWTPEEDAKLTEAMKTHGEDWAAVAVLVPGRTFRQCRERWVQNLDPANTGTGTWTPIQDARLTKVVQKLGEDWVAVAVLVSGRASQRCRQMWVHHLDPDRTSNAVED